MTPNWADDEGRYWWELEASEAKVAEELFEKSLLQPIDAHDKAREEMMALMAEYEGSGPRASTEA